MIDRMAFKEDLQEWKAVEREFASRIMKWDVSKIEFSQWKFKDRDVKATFKKLGQEVEKTFEIKNDIVSERTGNVWFEVTCNSEPSGVFASKADYIVYKLWDKFYYVDRARLLLWLASVPKDIVMWGDGNKSELFLVKKEFFNAMTKEL